MNASTVSLLAVLSVQSADVPTLAVPNVADLTIKTRRTIDRPDSSVETDIISLKGARQRRETIVERPPHVSRAVDAKRMRLGISIAQCDERRTVLLNDEAKTYAYLPIVVVAKDFARMRRPAIALQRETTTGSEVTITVDAADTGERRQIGSYTARRVITTTTTEPGPGASAMASVVERDGWYVDLPPADCRHAGDQQESMLVAYLHVEGARDQIRVKHLRTARRGYAIQEITRTRTVTDMLTTKVELIEFSDARLDDAHFTVPPDYRPALWTLGGGYDLTRPDTLMNRLTSLWEGFRDWSNRVFR